MVRLQGQDDSALSRTTNRFLAIWDLHPGQPLDNPSPSPFAEFSANGRHFTTWRLPQCSAPAPAWLPELAEAVVGIRMNENLAPTNVPWAERLRIQWQVAENPATNDCARRARWFLADRNTRAVAPLSSLSVPEYVQRRIEENTLESLQEAVRLSPTNGLAFARLAKLAPPSHGGPPGPGFFGKFHQE